MDKYLFDIPLAEYLYHREYRPRLHLHLGNLPDDRTALKMTGFNISQLHILYRLFGLRDFVQAHHETMLLIGTNSFHPVTGAKACYRIDLEELLLYSLTRIKTDPGGNYRPLLWWGLCSLDLRTPLAHALP